MTTAPGTRSRLSRLIRLPLLYLLLQIGLSAIALDVNGRLVPEHRPDTRSYERASKARTLEVALRQHRTVGYPTFLRTMRAVGGRGHLLLIPKVHAALFFGAVVLCWFAVRDWTGSGWVALAAATPLTWPPVFLLVPKLLPDLLASALAIMAISLLLMLVRKPGSWPRWGLLTVLVILSYQVRPAYLFMIPWIPLMGWCLRICREGRPKLSHLRWAIGLGLATLLPFLVFASTRRALVGHFGLVAFSGWNLIGITASLLDDEVIETLPADTRELAARILAQRSARGWQPLSLDGDIRIWQAQYLSNNWEFAINQARRRETKYAREAKRRGEVRRFRDIEVNDTLMAISRGAIRQRPRQYFKWVRDTSATGVGRMLRFPWVRWPLLVLAVALPIAWFRDREANVLDLRLAGLLLVFGSFTVTHLLLVVLVTNTFDRYIVQVALLLPTALCVLLFYLWRGPPGATDLA